MRLKRLEVGPSHPDWTNGIAQFRRADRVDDRLIDAAEVHRRDRPRVERDPRRQRPRLQLGVHRFGAYPVSLLYVETRERLEQKGVATELLYGAIDCREAALRIPRPCLRPGKCVARGECRGVDLTAAPRKGNTLVAVPHDGGSHSGNRPTDCIPGAVGKPPTHLRFGAHVLATFPHDRQTPGAIERANFRESRIERECTLP